MRFLTGPQVASLLDADALIDALAPAMADLSAGRASMPTRICAMVEGKGLLGDMPVYLPSSNTLSTKLVTVFPGNPQSGLPSHQAYILVFDPDTGALVAMLDAEYITAARTAAGSALATRLLAREDADTLLLVGTGVQARSHARAIPRVRPVTDIRILGRSPEKAETLADELADLDAAISVVASFAEAASGASIICATTHAPEPVVFGDHVAPGTHINSVGLNFSGRELDDDVISRSRIFVESRSSALFEGPGGAFDLTQPIKSGLITGEAIEAEIGDLVSGVHPGRTAPDDITLYKSVGVAVQDAVAARLVLDAAETRNIGTEIDL